jgi:hypothetical protein
MVTLVYKRLTLLPVGPRSTVTAIALLPAGTTTVGRSAGRLLPPPHPAMQIDSSVPMIQWFQPLTK